MWPSFPQDFRYADPSFFPHQKLMKPASFFPSLRTMALSQGIPSGKRLHSCWKSPFLMGKSTISMAIFQFANCKRHNQRLYHIKSHSTTIKNPMKIPLKSRCPSTSSSFVRRFASRQVRSQESRAVLEGILRSRATVMVQAAARLRGGGIPGVVFDLPREDWDGMLRHFLRIYIYYIYNGI